MAQYFHFTLGPVQSFVGQARRTRDFWAGSFILSWLSGVAMLAVKAQGGEILFPKADENFLAAIRGEQIKKLPNQGSIPNRFKAKVADEFDGELVVKAVKDAWRALASSIYKDDLHSVDLATRDIWERQTENFWDMSWVLTPEENDSSGLDRRKNWRSQYLPDEPGIKCTLMGDWQELSSIKGVRRKDREAREEFWTQVAKKCRPSDFGDEREQLCAMAYIKRRFDKYFKDFAAPVLQGNDNLTPVHGWKVPSSVPSVSYIAAAPWFAEVIRQEGKEGKLLNNFISAAKQCSGTPEFESTLCCVENAAKAVGLKQEDISIDGNMFHQIALDNPNIFPKKPKRKNSADWDSAQKVKKMLKPLLDKYGAISPFYAVLMMDGDSLGVQMSNSDKQGSITRGLAAFTQGVPEIVKEHNGFLIYAGGDDVLALITLEDALHCAAHLRAHYMNCFAKQNAKEQDKNKHVHTTISAAIIYTHINTPLKNILRDAHDLLDHVAKDGAGRDALAVRVYKGSGPAVEWAKKWDNALLDTAAEILLHESESNHAPKLIYELDKVLQQFTTQDNKKPLNKEESTEVGQFSNKFFYRIRQRFALFGIDESMETLPKLDNRNTQTSTFSIRELQNILCERCLCKEYKRVSNNDIEINGLIDFILKENKDKSFYRAALQKMVKAKALQHVTLSIQEFQNDLCEKCLQHILHLYHLHNVLCMDFIQSADNQKLTLKQAQDIIKPLLIQCYSPISKTTKVDAALLIRFLAQKGIERGGK